MDDIILEAIKSINANEEIEDMQESTASFPSEDLPLDIWDKTEDSYTLKPELKETILNALSQYPDLDLIDSAQSIRIVGSIGTNLYDEDADIDVHIEPKPEVLEGKSEEELEELQRNVMSWFKEERDEHGWYVNQHPLEVYLNLSPMSDYFSDTVYDLLTDSWIKVPKKYDMNYNPYTEYGDLFTEIDEVLTPTDLLLGKLHRLCKDFQRMTKSSSSSLVDDTKEKVKQTILALYNTEEKWYEIRKRNSAKLPDQLPEDPNELELSQDWKRDNTIFKLIGSVYGYKSVISKLSNLIDENEELVEDALTQIPTILSEFYGA